MINSKDIKNNPFFWLSPWKWPNTIILLCNEIERLHKEHEHVKKSHRHLVNAVRAHHGVGLLIFFVALSSYGAFSPPYLKNQCTTNTDSATKSSFVNDISTNTLSADKIQSGTNTAANVKFNDIYSFGSIYSANSIFAQAFNGNLSGDVTGNVTGNVTGSAGSANLNPTTSATSLLGIDAVGHFSVTGFTSDMLDTSNTVILAGANVTTSNFVSGHTTYVTVNSTATGSGSGNSKIVYYGLTSSTFTLGGNSKDGFSLNGNQAAGGGFSFDTPVPSGNYASNLMFRAKPGSTMGAGTNVILYIVTNGVLATSLTTTVTGDGSTAILQSKNTANSCSWIGVTNCSMLVSNMSASSTPSTAFSWSFEVY